MCPTKMAENSSGLMCKTCGKRFIGTVRYKRHTAVCGINLTGDTIEWKFVSVDQNEPDTEHQLVKEENETTETTHEDSLEGDECSVQLVHERSRSLQISEVHTIKSRPKRVKKGSMNCKVCAAKFKTNKALLLHVKSCNEKNSFTFKCSKCEKIFADRQNLARHENTIHQTDGKNIFQCSMCEKSFNRIDNFKRHLKSCKNRLKVDSFTCYYCGKKFNKKNSIKSHIPRHQRNENAVQCEICGAKFKGVSPDLALKRHIKEYHVDNKLTGNLKCPFCIRAFFSRENILCHLVEEHDITLDHQHLSFPSMDQFNEWKASVEKRSLTFFRNRRGFAHTKNYSMSTYECHRSGCYRPKTDGRQRRIRLQGTKKIGSFCPAEINLCVRKADGTCRVAFTNVHVGHNVCDETELAYLAVPRDERAELASKISNGLSYDEILKQHSAAEKDRLYLLTRKDLNNISRAYNIREKVVESDKDVDVESFAKEHQKSIIFLRQPGETCEDFFVILMTEKQQQVLQKFGSKVISADGTFTLTHSRFLLLTLLVIDDYHEAVPVAFAISSRKDFAVVDVFLDGVRQRVGALKTQLFMSDVQFAYHEKWCAIMGAAENRPFCKWYVPETWRRQLTKIADPAKRAQARDRFYAMLTQLDERLFRSSMDEFFAATDAELVAALEPIRRADVESWSRCRRENARANSAVYVDSLNHKLRYFYGKVAAAKTLSALLAFIDGYLNVTECELRRREIRGVVSYKLCDLRRRHDECLKAAVRVENTEDGGWYVSVADAGSEVADVHFVGLRHDSCVGCRLYCEQCKTCALKYRCTCADNALKSNMCKHIHAVSMRLNGAQVGCADLADLLHSSSNRLVETTDNGFCNFHTCDSNKLIDSLPAPQSQFDIENVDTSNTIDLEAIL